jgi:hypothetical protein
MRLQAVCVFASLGVVAAASAERIDLFVFENADGAEVSSLDLWVDVVDRGAYADFVFHNDSTVASTVTNIYIESTDFSTSGLTDGRIENPQPAGVDFRPGSAPPTPPGSIAAEGGAWQGNLFSAKAKKPGSGKDGIDPGEHLVLQFDLDGIAFSDLIDALTGDSPAFRIAQHVQGIGEFSVWTVNGDGENAIVPLPSGAALSLAGLAIVATRRRR